MTTFAHTETGRALDPAVDQSSDAYKARFAADITAQWTVEQVPDGTQHGAMPGSNGTWINPAPAVTPTPQPNTPNNPYFGKAVLTGAQFVGLCIGVLGVVTANRITSDVAFDAIKLWVTTEGVLIDVDDKAGQFLGLAGLPGGDGYLTLALAKDGQPLMSRAQRDAIMAAWK